MGKKDKKRLNKDPIILELEEREKIKQSILEVFRKRLSSPDGGGAILVGKGNTKSQSNSQITEQVSNESTSTMTDSEASTSSDKQTHKRRRRKKKQKTQKKVKKTDTGRQDVTKLLKIAHDARQTSRQTADKTTVSLISQNRLTRKMGLFNRGKKSSTISREINIPENVKKKTQEDLKKILNHSDQHADEDMTTHLEPISVKNSPDILPNPSNQPLSLNSKKFDLGYHSGRSNPITPSSPKPKTVVSSTSCLSTASSEDLQDLLTKEVPMEEIGEELIKRLDIRQFFPGRNLLEETVEDLRKVMKQNSFSTTPVTKRTKDMDSVKRKLLESPVKSQQGSQHTTRSTDSQQKQKYVYSEKQNKQTTRNDFLSILSPKQTSPNIHDDFLAILSPKKSGSKTFIDGSTMLRNNNIQSQRYLTQSPKFKKKQLPDGKTLLKCNDEKLIAEACQQMQQLSSKTMDVDRGNALRLLEQNEKVKQQTTIYHNSSVRDIQQDILSLLPDDLDNTHHSSQSSGYHGSENRYSLDDYMARKRNNENNRYSHDDFTARTRFNNPSMEIGTEYMPTFHTKQEYKENYQTMDILDYLDDSLPPRTNPPMTLTETDNVPVWLPANVHVLVLPKKPTFDSPSPEKLRPRFMH